MDKITALSILNQARAEVLKKGMLFPEIKEENVDVKDDMPIFKADWNILEDRMYRPTLTEIEKVIFEIMGKKWVEPEGGFWIHYDENFKKEIPDIWKKKSREENASVEITDPTLQGAPPKPKDEYKTYSDAPVVVREEPAPLKLETPSPTISKKAEYEVIIDGEELPDTPIMNLPDDTYIDLPD